MSFENKETDETVDDLDKTISVDELNASADKTGEDSREEVAVGQEVDSPSSDSKKKAGGRIPKADSGMIDDFQEAEDAQIPEQTDQTKDAKSASEKRLEQVDTGKEDTKDEQRDYHPRQVHLVVARVEPWTVMKVSFLLSVCFGIAMILASILVWMLLNSMHVFSSVENFIHDIDPTGTIADLIDYIRLPRVVALSTILAIGNVFLMTALSTIGSILYNLSVALVGGVKLSLMDD